MERLTIPDVKIDGGTRRTVIDTRKVKEYAMTIYWALKKYEDTGLTPEQIINLQEESRWIPVEERLPKEHDSIFEKWKGTDKWSKSMFEKTSGDVNVTVEYEDGKRKTITAHTVDGKWALPNRIIKQKVIAWRPLPDSYCPERSERK